MSFKIILSLLQVFLKMKTFHEILFLLVVFFTADVKISWANLYPWTDLDGRTLQARFVKLDQKNLTIDVNGQPFDIPINTLSPESKALATMLQAQQKPAKKLYDWTDASGRTIQASFVSSTMQSVTLEVNGKQTTLPLSMFNDASQALAEKLSASKKGILEEKPKEPKASNIAPKVDLEGELDPSKVYPWKNQSSQEVEGKFLDLSKDSLKILINSGRQEVSIPLASLSKQSRSLATKLKALINAEAKENAALVKKRKSMKVPAVKESDLDLEHELSNAQGQSIKAKFIEASDAVVILEMSGKPKPLELSWSSFSDQSVATLEALRRKKAEVDSRKPKISPPKKNRLAYYASGKYKGYHTILEAETYVVAVRSSGNGLDIFVKQEQAGSSIHPLGVPRLGVGFGTYYTDKTDPKRHRNRGRNIKNFNQYPEPSTDRELLELSGTYTNGGTFEYNIELKESGLMFWSKMKDPTGEEWPSRHRIGIAVRGVVADAKNLSLEKVKSAVGDGTFSFNPVSGKTAQVPMDLKWTDVRKKMKVNTNNLVSMELSGKPYDPVKISITSISNRDMRLDMDKAYAKTFPLQGVSLQYFALEERKRQEVPKNKALKIILKPN
ncbi:MAG: hypothetical protein CBC20_01220 [Verrucomicrobia bacterium TMED60]|nr:MAG: hypothetical protein CBC20_01220 [Verrucomicrobia bacterium TMED60]